MIGGDGCSGMHLKGEPRGEVIPRKRLRGDDVDTAAGGGYTRGREALLREKTTPETNENRQNFKSPNPQPETTNKALTCNVA